ncbi:MAG: UDP-N-acetylmuramate--L-alanine ligase [Treponema sp.]
MEKSLLPNNLSGFRIHMVGIKGTGMTALAQLLVSRGAVITGSDVKDVFYTDEILKNLSIEVTLFDDENIKDDIKLVIYSAAYTFDSNIELKATLKKNIAHLSYPEALGQFSRHSYSCGVCGVHGKTTTTGMVGTILKELGLSASTLAGSSITSFGSSCVMLGGDKYFVAETCEYNRHFLNFHPKEIILTSIEGDHQDCYPTYESILTAFLTYINSLPEMGKVFYCEDDKGAREAARLSFSSRPDLRFIAYGENAIGDYGLKITGIRDEKLHFSLSGFAGEFSLPIPGKYNALNATVAIALSLSLLQKEKEEITIEDLGVIRRAISKYTGAKRRFELIGKVKDIVFLDDYAHHPTAIKALLKGLKEFYPTRRIIADFMPHTYSRTEALLDDFANSFNDADIVILHKIYASAREVYNGGVTGEVLFEKTKRNKKNVHFFSEVLEAKTFVLEILKEGDLFVTIGAGDNWQLGKAVILDLKNNLQNIVMTQ